MGILVLGALALGAMVLSARDEPSPGFESGVALVHQLPPVLPPLQAKILSDEVVTREELDAAFASKVACAEKLGYFADAIWHEAQSFYVFEIAPGGFEHGLDIDGTMFTQAEWESTYPIEAACDAEHTHWVGAVWADQRMR